MSQDDAGIICAEQCTPVAYGAKIVFIIIIIITEDGIFPGCSPCTLVEAD
jgi:hypothetical protein